MKHPWPLGTRVEKCNSDPGDTFRDGTGGTLSLPPPLLPEPLQSNLAGGKHYVSGMIDGENVFFYWVMFDPFPDFPIGITFHRIKRTEDSLL